MTNGELMNIREAAEQLHGANYSEADMRRLRVMVGNKSIEYTLLNRQIFIPRWQVDKLGKSQRHITTDYKEEPSGMKDKVKPTKMQKLKRVREQSGVSVNEMAKFLGIVPTAYRRYERGEVSPKLATCKKICKVLDTTLSELFDDDYVPPKRIDTKLTIRPGQIMYIEIEADSLN